MSNRQKIILLVVLLLAIVAVLDFYHNGVQVMGSYSLLSFQPERMVRPGEMVMRKEAFYRTSVEDIDLVVFENPGLLLIRASEGEDLILQTQGVFHNLTEEEASKHLEDLLTKQVKEGVIYLENKGMENMIGDISFILHVPAGVNVEIVKVYKLQAYNLENNVRVRGVQGTVTLGNIKGNVDIAGSPVSLICRNIQGSLTLNGGSQEVMLMDITGPVQGNWKAQRFVLERVSGPIGLNLD